MNELHEDFRFIPVNQPLQSSLLRKLGAAEPGREESAVKVSTKFRDIQYLKRVTTGTISFKFCLYILIWTLLVYKDCHEF